MPATDIDSRQSTLIKAMRFPLIVLVVIAHSLGFESMEIAGNPSGWTVYHFFSEMISHTFAPLSVCWFYVFSGYLFFNNWNEEKGFLWSIINKCKKRIKTLLIPYIIWNLLAVGIVTAISLLFIRLGIGTHNNIPQFDPIEWLWSGPADYPLYFIRDLIILIVATPILYQLFKRFKWLSLFFLVAIYFSPFETGIPTMRSIFFFGLGSWLSIWRYTILDFVKKTKWPAFIITIILLPIVTILGSTNYHETMLRVFFPFGMVFFMNICDRLIENDNICSKLCSLSSSVFFIYAAHEIQILGWTKGAFVRLLGDNIAGCWIGYFGVPIVVIFVCLALFKILNKIMPKTLSLICGGR